MGFDRTFCSHLFLWVAKHGWLKPKTRLLVAVSGGPDSMALLHWLMRFKDKFGIELGVAHLDHQWRPESNRESLWLQHYCTEKNLPFYTAQMAPRMSTRQTSLEAQARQIRYEFMQKVMKNENFSHLATGHTGTDQVESILMRLVRGSIQGLSGIKVERPLGEGMVIRPLLTVPKANIYTYNHLHQVPYLEDATNQDPSFFRNRIRHHILPLLQQENPAIETLASELSDIMEAENQWFQEQSTTIFEHLVIRGDPMALPIKACQNLPLALQRRIICLALEGYSGNGLGFTHRHIEAVRHLLSTVAGKQVMLPGGLVVQHSKGDKLTFVQTAKSSLLQGNEPIFE